MNKFRTYRRPTNPDTINPDTIFTGENEFNLYLKENQHIIKDMSNHAQRYQELKAQHGESPELYEEFFKQSTEYVQRSALPRPWKIVLHREIVTHYFIPENCSSVLDFGCGAGNDGLFYANLGFKVTFSDVDAENLRFIRWRLARRGINYCQVIPSNQNFVNMQFDLVLAIDCFEHIINAHDYFNQICTSLKPEGLFYISFNSSGEELDCYTWEAFNQNIKPILDEKFVLLENERHGSLYRLLKTNDN